MSGSNLNRPLVKRWLSFLRTHTTAPKFTREQYDQGRDWHDEQDALIEKMWNSPDFRPFMKLSSKAFECALRFIEYHPQVAPSFPANEELVPSKMLTPFGGAVYGIHMKLQDYLNDRSAVRAMILRSGLKRTDLRKVISFEQTEKVWADCQCCIESGGDWIIQMSDGTELKFDYYGNRIMGKKSRRRMM